jgi:hypothetical protein
VSKDRACCFYCFLFRERGMMDMKHLLKKVGTIIIERNGYIIMLVSLVAHIIWQLRNVTISCKQNSTLMLFSMV